MDIIGLITVDRNQTDAVLCGNDQTEQKSMSASVQNICSTLLSLHAHMWYVAQVTASDPVQYTAWAIEGGPPEHSIATLSRVQERSARWNPTPSSSQPCRLPRPSASSCRDHHRRPLCRNGCGQAPAAVCGSRAFACQGAGGPQPRTRSSGFWKRANVDSLSTRSQRQSDPIPSIQLITGGTT
jgi:hypothetical protein